MSLIYIGTIILATGVLQKIFENTNNTSTSTKKNTCIDCAYAHKENGLNYSWLNEEFGEVLKIEFEEPVEKNNLDFKNRPIFRNGEMIGNWKPYTDAIWNIHCQQDVINHTPSKLVEQHLTAFVYPDTRFARLRFTMMKNGKIYQTEPTKRFYELERDFFSNKTCKK